MLVHTWDNRRLMLGGHQGLSCSQSAHLVQSAGSATSRSWSSSCQMSRLQQTTSRSGCCGIISGSSSGCSRELHCQTSVRAAWLPLLVASLQKRANIGSKTDLQQCRWV